MRVTAVRRTALVVSVMSLALLATACGDSDSDSKGGKHDNSSRSDNGGKSGTSESAGKDTAAKPGGAALTAAELEKASLAQGDVKNYEIEKVGPEEIIPAGAVTIDKQECLPLAHALFAVKQDKSVAVTGRQTASVPKKGTYDLTATMVGLSSYESEDAAGIVTGVREAAPKCGGGFTATADGEKEKLKVTKLTEEKATAGEEALAWTVMTEDEGKPAALKFVLVRQAGTVATFSAFHLGAGAAGDFPLPTAVMDAQIAKLG